MHADFQKTALGQVRVLLLVLLVLFVLFVLFVLIVLLLLLLTFPLGAGRGGPRA